MTKKLLGGLFVMLCLAVPLSAHHAANAKYDERRPVTIKGTVTKVEWMNPHIYTHVEAKDPESGKMTTFKVEGGPPNSLFRQGWRRDTVKAGDTVTVSGVRAKIATSTNIGLATITTADGKRLFGSQGGGGARGQGTQQQ